MADTDKTKKEDGAEHGWKQGSLQAAGFATLIADLSLLGYGFSTGQRNIGAAGAFGLAAGTTGAIFGHPKSEKRLEQLERRLGAYLRRQGVEIPKNPSTKTLNKENGVIDNAMAFLYAHPSQVMNVFYGLIGTEFVRGGIKSKEGALLTSGCLLIAGALSGLLIKEKQPDPKHPPHGIIERAKSWVQEKPLRLTGTLFNLNQVGLAINAYKERRDNPGKNHYLFKVVAVAAFTFANTMIALSSKSGSAHKMDEKTQNKLADDCAQVILAQPPETQNALLGHMAGFLADQPHMHLKSTEISELLHKRLAEVAKSRPAAGWQNRVGNAKNVQSQPALN